MPFPPTWNQKNNRKGRKRNEVEVEVSRSLRFCSMFPALASFPAVGLGFLLVSVNRWYCLLRDHIGLLVVAQAFRGSMATTKVAAAIQSIPEKKESLRKALEVLKSYSSSLASFTLEWKDLEAHLSAIEKSIEDRFKDLQDKEIKISPSAVEKSSAAADESEETPLPELKSLCLKMDGRGLRSFIIQNWKDLDAIRSELNTALRSAPNPPLLVLDAMHDFYPQNPVSEKAHAIKRTCLDLLERIQAAASEIKPSVREKAKKLAMDWRGKISGRGGDNGLEAFAFLQLLISYGLVSEFKVDDLLEVLALIARRKQIINLFKNLGLTENVPDLIEKLSSKGKQLDAVKVVYAFNLLDKFPPVPLLKAYIKASKKVAQEMRTKRNVSIQSQNEAHDKELGALRSVLKAVEDHKLESEYPRENIEKQIAQLQQQKADKKRTAAAAVAVAASNMETQHQQLNKRPRPSTITTSAPATAAAHPLPRVQTNPQIGLTDQAPPPYMGMAAGALSCGLAPTGSSFYNHAGPSLSGAPMGLGGNPSPPRSYLYRHEPFAGDLYDRPVVNYSSYSLSGLPPASSYRLSLYHP